MSVLRSIPQTDFPIGQTIIGPDNIPGNINQYLLIVHQINWPNLGGRAFDYDAQVSLDGGDTWESISAGNVYDTVVPPKFGNPGGQFPIACSPQPQAQGARKLRIVIDFAKALTLSIDVQGNEISNQAQAAKIG